MSLHMRPTLTAGLAHFGLMCQLMTFFVEGKCRNSKLRLSDQQPACDL
jgi:hypothetical protein